MSQRERLSNIVLVEEPNFKANVSASARKVPSKGRNYLSNCRES